MSGLQTPAATAPPEPARRCPSCGSPLGPEQEWCLACGAATTTRVGAPRGWRVPIVAAGGLLALALAATLLALVALARSPETVSPAATPAPAAAVTPAATPALTPTPAPTVAPTPSPGGSGGGGGAGAGGGSGRHGVAGFAPWPAGRSAWTVVLESAPTRAKAARVARGLQARGVTVGILRSSDHPSLRPGYWVVFSGTYPTRAAAQSALSTLTSARSGAYVRRVTS